MNEQILKKPSRSRVRLLKMLKRNAEPQFRIDQDYLLQAYPDLFVGIEDEDDIDEFIELYLELIAEKAIDPNAYFSELGYLTSNRDVMDDVNEGKFHCGFQHWLEVGGAEKRGGWLKQSVVASATAATRRADPDGAPFFLPLSAFGVADPASLSIDEQVNILKRSGILDLDRYVVLHADVLESGADPMHHYAVWGHRERRSLHPFFDDNHYLAQIPELRDAGYAPVLHYLFVGASAGRSPHPLVDTAAYAARHDLDLAEANPLIHYTMSPHRDSLIGTPHFDEAFYIAHHPECVTFPGGPFHHFMIYGVYSGYKPNPHFNTRYYYSTHLGGD